MKHPSMPGDDASTLWSVSLDFSQHPQWPQVLSVYHKISVAGHRVYLAGGCVRDGLLNRQPKDFDLVCSAAGEDLEKLFPEALPVGKQFGIYILPFAGFQVEVAAFRRDDAYSDSRRPDRVLAGSPREDAERRDFTINALFYDLETQTLIDYVGGYKDVQAGRLRSVGLAQERFKEDALRLLRALRLGMQLGFELDKELWDAVCADAPLVAKVSGERRREELEKLLLSPELAARLTWLEDSQILVHGLEGERVFAERDFFSIWSQLLGAFKEFEEALHGFALMMWCATFVRGSVPLRSLEALKFSRRSLQFLKGVCAWAEPAAKKHWRDKGLGERRLQLKDPSQVWGLRFCAAQAPEECFWQKALEEAEELLLKGLPPPWIEAKDLLGRGYQPSPELGKTLRQLYLEQLEGRWGSREEALASLNELAPGPAEH